MSGEAVPASAEGRRKAEELVSMVLADVTRASDSTIAVAGTLAGLAGLVTTLSGLVPSLSQHKLGQVAISLAGLSVVLAVVGLAPRTRLNVRWSEPWRDLIDAMWFAGDAARAQEEVLRRNLNRIDGLGIQVAVRRAWVFASAVVLAGAIVLIVITILVYGVAANS